jgi:hypothetical protein
MIVLVSIESTKDKQIYAISRNGRDDCIDWVEISIDFNKKEFFAKKIQKSMLSTQGWKSVSNLTFPSSLFTRFLLDDPIDVEDYLS